MANFDPAFDKMIRNEGGFKLTNIEGDLRCCANCAHWHKKEYIHCQCSGPWGGDIFGDKNCTFRASEPTPGYAGDNNGE